MDSENKTGSNCLGNLGMDKEYDMESLNELIRALSEPEVSVRDTYARSTHTCKICRKSARRFRDSISEFEYADKIKTKISRRPTQTKH